MALTITESTVDPFIAKITATSLKNADDETRRSIQNALYNILFKAEYRPDENALNDGTDFGVYGNNPSQQSVSAHWPKAGTPGKYTISDAVLGPIKIGGSTSCIAYGQFVSKYVYWTWGTQEGPFNSQESFEKAIHKYADPGEWIRMNKKSADNKKTKSTHAIVFLGEADAESFYYADYHTYTTPNGTTTPHISVGKYTYKDFFEDYGNHDIYIYDTNDGSYSNPEGKPKSVAKVREDNDAADSVVAKINCPIEATVILGNEVLDSRFPGTSSFGSVERNGDEVTFTLDFREDYEFVVTGTGSGTMTFSLEYYSGTQLLDTRTFVDVPITEETVIQTSGFDIGADFTLSIDNDGDGTEDSAWGARANETVYAPDTRYEVPNYDEMEEENTNINFSDVSESDWFYDGVTWAVANGITSGTGINTFTPGRICSHGEIITFLWRAAGRPTSSVTAPVVTEPYDDFRAAANWAYEKGIIDGSFRSGADCTRADTVTYMWKAADSPPAEASSFTDVSAGADYAKAVNWAVANGVTVGTGDGTTFSPYLTCDRSQIVTFLYRAYAD